MNVVPLPFTPVVILGAGRSGTNALRDMLTALPEFATWNCDEINPIWRHGNVSWPNDEIPVNRATPKIQKFIRRAFSKIWTQSGTPQFIVEKTCANTLRVPFIDQVLPEARYIHIVRDGVDVLASAGKRWQGDLELPGLPYFLAKARYAPWVDLPIYGVSFLRSRVGLLFGKTRRLSIWGPRFAGMDDMPDASLQKLCARQWMACVGQSQDALDQMNPDKVLTLRYEDFAANPATALRSILEFLGTTASDATVQSAASLVRSGSVGKGRKALEDVLEPGILDLIEPVQKKFGY